MRDLSASGSAEIEDLTRQTQAELLRAPVMLAGLSPRRVFCCRMQSYDERSSFYW
jgi:hypothetical protein